MKQTISLGNGVYEDIEVQTTKINVLGVEYEIIETTGQDDVRLSNADGWCGNYEKTILIEKNIYKHSQDGDIEQSRAERSKFIKRHEITHAFFNESGLEEYSQNEQLVSWIATQFPKLLKAFKEVGAIE